ncbi:hypothetical protein [Natranaerofaba carboxydovora]|uniref:hypothetical protein n=1 Tax=Natranaerofaba carboxydovora TaxID=2742683 RepID=UPI001F136460|nr:hypothetical protein [Natranaerofaba carboxydovora]UMZ72745.1 hypothetical protein ACONDI_00271 [Natranaerofaba carboxydovora]
MSNEQNTTPIPPPTLIERVKIDKVYEECKQIDVNKIEIDLPIDEDFDKIIDVDEVTCKKVNLIDKECEIIGEKKIRVWIKYEVIFVIDDEKFSVLETFEKTVTLSRAYESGLKPQCEVFLECLDAFIIDEDTIILCVGKLFLIKLFAHVQLLIPAYGFAPQPPECKEKVLDECPEYDPPWPPYPEQ